jgi:hypothetical protein
VDEVDGWGWMRWMGVGVDEVGSNLSASGAFWGGCSLGRAIVVPMATPSEAEPEYIRTTHAPSFLMTLNVL